MNENSAEARRELARLELDRLGLSVSEESLAEIARQLEVLNGHARTFLSEPIDDEGEPLPEFHP